MTQYDFSCHIVHSDPLRTSYRSDSQHRLIVVCKRDKDVFGFERHLAEVVAAGRRGGAPRHVPDLPVARGRGPRDRAAAGLARGDRAAGAEFGGRVLSQAQTVAMAAVLLTMALVVWWWAETDSSF